ncbi:MAG: RDD family protein [Thermoleophilaceae bacterium]
MEKPTKVVGQRVGAILIDSLIVFAFNTALFFAMAQTNEDILRGLGEGDIQLDTSTYFNLDLGDDTYSLVGGDFLLWLLITSVVGILYWMILPGLKGWTVGKLITGIRVVKDDGTCPAGIGKNVVRQLLWIADYFPYIIPYLTGFVVALTNDRNKRVGDIVAGTLVVRASAAGRPLPAGAGAQPGAAPFAAQPAAGGPGAAPVAAQPAAGGPAAPDWYPDPQGEKRLRYWDGAAWTSHTAD